MCKDKMLVDAYMRRYEIRKARKHYNQIAESIGKNAVRLVNDFFLFGIRDDVINYKSSFPFVSNNEYSWSFDDLDRALDEMRKFK